MRQSGEQGFSLLETLVAMAMLSVSATAILSAAERHVGSVTEVSDRLTARWVAENRLVELAHGAQDRSELVRMGGQQWSVHADLGATADSDLTRAEISVARALDPTAPLAQLTAFLDLSDREVR
ncbi:MAG: type II secretion system minor pseudopilin GspI [Pseudomonadota bacterium]